MLLAHTVIRLEKFRPDPSTAESIRLKLQEALTETY